jgi:hypothetical protein
MRRLPLSRMTVGVLIGALAGLLPTVLAAVGEDSPPDSPPVVTGPAIVAGSTWYTDGTKFKFGPPGTRISAYAVGALPGVSYRLVLGLGGSGTACEAIAQWINPNLVTPGPSGLIGRVTGTVPAGTVAGIYKLCFEDSSTGNLTGTGGTTFIVQDVLVPTIPTTTVPPPDTTTPPTLPPRSTTTVVTLPSTSVPLTIPTIPGPD